jgi:hypothetical protein
MCEILIDAKPFKSHKHWPQNMKRREHNPWREPVHHQFVGRHPLFDLLKIDCLHMYTIDGSLIRISKRVALWF